MTKTYGMASFAPSFADAAYWRLPDLMPGDGRPLYEQIAAAVVAAIEAGEFGQGHRVPGYPRVARRYGVCEDTAKRAYRLLREQGVIRQAPRLGHFVSHQPRRGLSNG